MKAFSKNIDANGYMHQDFGGNCKKPDHFMDGNNVYSFHIGWSEIPINTKSIAIFYFDYDSIPVCGFPFLHWAVANIDPNIKELNENASVLMQDTLIQGKNSTYSPLFSQDHKPNLSLKTQLFVGSAPPNCDHIYTVKVYAVNKMLDLKNGFFVNELMNQLSGNVLDKAEFKFIYKKVGSE
ncbi:MAG: YbhB/YbcL family Raf kinase inhibitor-like protein [Malacoplasma sp.]|nr:YbhB/YbcL family Raf kinase inhibitor-like protein [Malacoplasma sp.]